MGALVAVIVGNLATNAHSEDIGFLAGYWCVANGKNGMLLQIVSGDRVRQTVVTRAVQ